MTIATPSGSHKQVSLAQRVPLTDARCSSYPAPANGRVTLSDSGKGAVPGLQLRITSNGIRTFSVVYRPKGQPKQERKLIGRYGGAEGNFSLAQARKAARAIKVEVDGGANPQATRRADKAAPTVIEAWAGSPRLALQFETKDFVPHLDFKRRTTKPKTWSKLDRWFNAYVKSVIGECNVNEVTRRHIEQLLDNIPLRVDPNKARHRRPGAATTRCVAGLLSDFFNRLARQGYAKQRPMEGMFSERADLNSKPKPRNRPLTAEELPLYIRTLTKLTEFTDGMGRRERVDERRRDAQLLLLHSAQRFDQIGSLQWEFVRWEEESIYWPASKMKGQEHLVDDFELPMTETMRAILLRRWEAQDKPRTGFVFKGNKGGALAQSYAHRVHAGVCRAAGIRNYTQHDHRTTASTFLQNHGFDEYDVNRLHAHAFKTRSGRGYTGKLHCSRLREPLAAWEGILRKAMAGITGVVAAKA